MRIGIVDLGTNSVRLAIYQITEKGRALCIYKKKLMLRPGQGVFMTGRLKPATIRAITQAFQKFARRATVTGVESVLAVGTSALREAKNSRELIQKIERKSGISVKVISGRREAQLIALGIMESEAIPKSGYALFDIGGGSTEVSLCRGQKRLRSMSLPLGALRLQQLYLPEGAATPLLDRIGAVIKIRQHVQEELKAHLGSKYRRIDKAIGSSGTIRAVARLIDRTHARKEWRNRRRPSKKPRLGFNRGQLKDLVEKLISLNKTELARVPGMERRRLDIILSGSVLLLELMDFLAIEKLRTSNFALRDGLVISAKRQVRIRKSS